jgi:hypothetical protein
MRNPRVSIVWNSLNGDRILDRLARVLADNTGWSLSTIPDAAADIVYDLLYIDVMQRFKDQRHLCWAAYFSHYEPMTSYKRDYWIGAQWIPIKTITARQYLSLPGAHLVIPPIEKRFHPRHDKHSGRLRVGVSGFVDRSGRKGETMLPKLVERFRQVDFVASGQGWPVKIINTLSDRLPDFYNSLDIYLCTSLIEGIPMPPLESLACGIPIVIPVGVGLLDDLPYAAGIERYMPGNIESCAAALDKALTYARQLDMRPLAEVIRIMYNEREWASSHQRVFENEL